MKIYAVIQMADNEIVSLAIHINKSKAESIFEKVAQEDSLLEPADDDWKDNELTGTLRIAGDDACSVQFVEREILYSSLVQLRQDLNNQ